VWLYLQLRRHGLSPLLQETHKQLSSGSTVSAHSRFCCLSGIDLHGTDLIWMDSYLCLSTRCVAVASLPSLSMLLLLLLLPLLPLLPPRLVPSPV